MPRHQAHTAHHTTHKSRGSPGPNAGSSRSHSSLFWVLIQATAGARVPSTAAMEGGPALRLARGAGKPSGTVQQGREQTFTQAIKRSYRRACKRASASVQDGTWYRGKWHTRADLNAMRNCPVPTTAALPPRSTRRPGTRQRPFRPEHHIRVLSWNTGVFLRVSCKNSWRGATRVRQLTCTM